MSIYCIRARVLVRNGVLKTVKSFQRYLIKWKELLQKGEEIKWKKTLKYKRVFLYTGMIMTTPLLFYSLSGSFSHHSCYRRMKASSLGNAAFYCLELFH